MSDPLQDGISSVELLTYMGDDLMVVNAARVSYGKSKTQFDEVDAKLLHYLATHNHWTPFSHPQLQFRIKMPLFVAREWYRHTVGFTRNEVSRRYVKTVPEFFFPTGLRLAPDSGMSKQGSKTETHMESERLIAQAKSAIYETTGGYLAMTEMMGISAEQARIFLPQNMYTEFIETASLYAYARLCGLRLNPDAQQETRKYAECVSEVIETLFPISWKELSKSWN